MGAIKAILFDHDGTLVDSEFVHFQMWQTILEAYGLHLTQEEYVQEYAGIPSSANAQVIVAKYDLSLTGEALNNEKERVTSEYLSKQAFPLVEGAKAVIQSLYDEKVKMAIVTGASRDAPRATVSENRLHDYFNTLVSADDVSHSKPAPDCYLLAVKRLGLKPGDCIAIEDTANGVRAAVAANIPCVAIATKMSQHHDLSKADKVVTNLVEAGNWIKQHYF